ncbi:hypothetical protein [Roseimaritima multifibrata]|uniref:hypothetical protein n=1 Tax=Roseimaritima multifibrata TaxID=1930274 RepID=UPI001C54F8B2|nr:hypothetical protein [Roseimaritima multifibrata]
MTIMLWEVHQKEKRKAKPQTNGTAPSKNILNQRENIEESEFHFSKDGLSFYRPADYITGLRSPAPSSGFTLPLEFHLARSYFYVRDYR